MNQEAVALRIEQLEAQNAMLVEAMRDALSYAEYLADTNWNCEVLAKARAALANVEAARTGANT